MKSSFFILSLLFVMGASSPQLPPNDLIGDACRTTPFSDFCISALRSDPHSSSAQSSAQLGIVLVDQIDSKAKSTLAKIDGLISKVHNPAVKDALSYCRDSYSAMIQGSVPSSREALDEGDPKFAEQYMTDAAQETDRCQDKFKGVESPLSSENDFVHKAASDVAAIAKALE